MTVAAIRAWAAKRRWPSAIAIDHEMHLPLQHRRPPFAECAGPDDPVCGRARFSVHDCNGAGPSRADLVAATR